MQYQKYKETQASNLPPALENGTVLNKVTGIKPNTFDLNGVATEGMHVLADGKTYRTSSKVIMDILTKFFADNPNEVLENVKVIAPRGKRYLTLESI
jgi:hypothetical protein